MAYRTTWHPDGCDPRTPPESEPGMYTIDLGVPGDEAYLGWGWYAPETIGDVTWRWAGARPRARVYVDLPPGDYSDDGVDAGVLRAAPGAGAGERRGTR